MIKVKDTKNTLKYKSKVILFIFNFYSNAFQKGLSISISRNYILDIHVANKTKMLEAKLNINFK